MTRFQPRAGPPATPAIRAASTEAEGSPSLGPPRALGPHRRVVAFLADAYFSFDRRTLGLTRILLGFLLLMDLLRRARHWLDFYTDDGLFPRSLNAKTAPWTVLDSLSTRLELSIAFVVILVVYACLLVGFHTKVAHALSFIAITSVVGRVQTIENGGNWALDLLVLWTLFLPMGDRFSIDAVRRPPRANRETGEDELGERAGSVPTAPYVSVIGPVILVQIAAIYFFNALAKTGPAWRSLHAVRWVLYTDRLVTPLAAHMRDYLPGWLLVVITAGVLSIERLLPLLLLCPWHRLGCRRLAIVLVNLLHVSLGTMLVLGDFSWACCVFSSLLISREDWDAAARAMRRSHRARVVRFDPAAPRALAVCRALQRLDGFELLTFRAGPGAPPLAVERPGDAGAPLGGARAVRDVVAALPLGPLLAWIARVPPIGWALDAWWASLGGPVRAKRAPPRLGPRAFARLAPGLTVLRELAVLVLFAGAVLDGANSIDLVKKAVKVPEPAAVRTVTRKLRLIESWQMFAPNIVDDDAALVVDAITADGRHLDPFTGEAPNFDLTHAKSLRYSQFFCDYTKRVHDDPDLLRPLRAWILRYAERTGRGEDRIVGGAVYWLYDRNPPPGETVPNGLEIHRLFGLAPEELADGFTPTGHEKLH